MKKLRSVFRVLAWTVAIFLALWLVVWSYVILNKKSLVAQVNAELSSKVKGEISIADLEPSLLSTFPHVSLRLSTVTVRDTLWKQHHHDLLKADKIFIRLKLLSLFSGSPEISKVIIEKGSFYIFSDTSGYSNEYMFKSQNGSSGGGSSNSRSAVPDIEFKDVRLTLELNDRNKLYDFEVSRLKCDIKNRETSLQLDVKTDMIVHSLAFNTDNGSFVKEKSLEGKFRLYFDRVKKKLNFEKIGLQIDGHPFAFSGGFDFSGPIPLYFLSIKTEKLNYKRASALLSNNISRKLDSFKVEKPINVITTIDGRTLPNKIPLVNIEVATKDNIISLPIGEITDASFEARFNNQLVLSERRVDKNSGFTFTGVSGKLENIPFRSDTVSVTNLEHPVLSLDLHSSFKLEALNDLLGTSSIEFTKGSCQADVRYRGLMIPGDTAAASIFGKINLQGAAINYTPRNLALTNCSGNIVFDDKDVYIRQLKAQSANSELLMNGTIKNLTSLIDKSPEKAILDWKISSPKLNLGDFISFLDKRTATKSKKSSKKKLVKLPNQIDKTLQDCSVEIQLNADRLIYRKFDATNVAANVQLTDKLVSLKNVFVQQGGGTLTFNGSLQEAGAYSTLKLKSNIVNVDIEKLFKAFNNFGQDGITDKNLRGRLSANIDIAGAINGKAEIVENSLIGIINLQIKNGELINFEPVEKISETAFKKRDFSHIRFADLKERLDVNGSQIKVNRMEIQSTVVTMFVEGIYDVKKGTDLSIQIPLSNLSKRDEDFELRNKGIHSKTGVSIRLRAKTGDDGKAKISWDPFKLALKKKGKGVPGSTEASGIDSSRVRQKK